MKKKIIGLIILFSLVILQVAHADSLFSSGSLSGVFGGPLVKYTKINNEDALILGARGGWAFNSTFSVGGGAYGIMNDIPINASQPDTNFINLGYGGIIVEYIGMTDNIIHWQANLLIGTGVVGIRNGNDTGKNDMIFILEPCIEGVVNITASIRASAGLSYRIVSGVDSDNFDGHLRKNDLSNFTLGLSVMFGSF